MGSVIALGHVGSSWIRDQTRFLCIARQIFFFSFLPERSVFSLTNYFLKSNMSSGFPYPVEDAWGSVFPTRLEGASLAHPPAAEQCTGPLEGGVSASRLFQGCSWGRNLSSCPRSGRMESTNTQTLMVASEQDLFKRRKVWSSQHRHGEGVESPARQILNDWTKGKSCG